MLLCDVQKAGPALAWEGAISPPTIQDAPAPGEGAQVEGAMERTVRGLGRKDIALGMPDMNVIVFECDGRLFQRESPVV